MGKKVSFKAKHINGPPEGKSWIWHLADMRTTEAWRQMPIYARRLLDRIEVEHMAHNGKENGRLRISYSQFVEWGIGRRYIPKAIDYCIKYGFLDYRHGSKMKEAPNEYRLTYQATTLRTATGATEWSAPTNEWQTRAGKQFFECTKVNSPSVQKCTQPRAAATRNGGNPRLSHGRGVVSYSEHTSITSGYPPVPAVAPLGTPATPPPASPSSFRPPNALPEELEKIGEIAVFNR